jgi:hypothetical protein
MPALLMACLWEVKEYGITEAELMEAAGVI